jgi:hypothetical protein
MRPVSESTVRAVAAALLVGLPGVRTAPAGGDWAMAMVAARSVGLAANWHGAGPAWVPRAMAGIEDRFPVESDWLLQDAGTGIHSWFSERADAAIEGGLAARAGADAPTFPFGAAAGDLPAMERYAEAASRRRAARLGSARERAPRVVFTLRRTVRPSFFAYTEGQSDAQSESHFLPGSELRLMEWDGDRARVRTLLADPTGVIRDPAVTWDGERVLFAWKKSHREDDYHIYEMTLASGAIRQITTGLGFADYEPACLPNGDIVFSSTRCVQTVDCFWTEVSNLYTCDPDGRFLRRLGFDQVHTVYPALLDDGRVVYTRWDYNDRGQVFPQGLFQMNPDGTGQAEFYGNNSWFPTTIAHARGIPGTGRVLAIFCGHHSTQAGKLGVVDPARGRQENTGAQLAGPLRPTAAERIDAYGQNGALFQYPFPLSDRECIVAYAPFGWNARDRRRGDADFGLYWFDFADGRRELLVRDSNLPCQQPVPVVARTPPRPFPSTVDYRRTNGTVYVRDVHEGPGLAGVPRGSIRRIRIVALDFRAAGIGSNGSAGPGGGALISTPVAIGNGTWDAKIVLGETPVDADGSAFFTVPARTPVYFQMIDERGFVAQTMRSWVTLQPGENRACVGCHEDQNGAPAGSYGPGLALRGGPRALEPFQGPARAFSFAREVQPILDRHCVRCHNDRPALAGRWGGAGGGPGAGSRATGRGSREGEAGSGESGAGSRRTGRGSREKEAGSGEAGRGGRETAAGAAEIAREEPGTPNPEPGTARAFSLLGAPVEDRAARRFWSDAYLALTHARPDRRDEGDRFRGDYAHAVLNWPGAQSVPTMLPPYTAGSARSRLFEMLASGHGGTRLSRDEVGRLACWVDLYVPFCGDYEESAAWSGEERAKYRRYLAKRRAMEDMERDHIAAFLAAPSGPTTSVAAARP